MQQIAGRIPRPVLLIGEPGSGREAFARYLHSSVSAPFRVKPFVTLVVAASLREDTMRKTGAVRS